MNKYKTKFNLGDSVWYVSKQYGIIIATTIEKTHKNNMYTVKEPLPFTVHSDDLFIIKENAIIKLLQYHEDQQIENKVENASQFRELNLNTITNPTVRNKFYQNCCRFRTIDSILTNTLHRLQYLVLVLNSYVGMCTGATHYYAEIHHVYDWEFDLQDIENREVCDLEAIKITKKMTALEAAGKNKFLRSIGYSCNCKQGELTEGFSTVDSAIKHGKLFYTKIGYHVPLIINVCGLYSYKHEWVIT
jgi:hypothetical protein